MHNIYGILLIVIGITIIVFGEIIINLKGGTILKLFTMPSIHAKFVKWGAGLVAIYFGIGLILNWWKN